MKLWVKLSFRYMSTTINSVSCESQSLNIVGNQFLVKNDPKLFVRVCWTKSSPRVLFALITLKDNDRTSLIRCDCSVVVVVVLIQEWMPLQDHDPSRNNCLFACLFLLTYLTNDGIEWKCGQGRSFVGFRINNGTLGIRKGRMRMIARGRHGNRRKDSHRRAQRQRHDPTCSRAGSNPEHSATNEE